MEGAPGTIRDHLGDGSLTPADAVPALVRAAHAGHGLGSRQAAFSVLGTVAGRGFGASWEVAERAAFALLELARDADTPAERAALLRGMQGAFRNAWLLSYVHSRLLDEEDEIVRAAIGAAGGLAFPALEETLTGFLAPEIEPGLRVAAIRALGRMGATLAAGRLAQRLAIPEGAREATAILAALAEIRAPAGADVAAELLAHGPAPTLLVAATRYLAEIGDPRLDRHLPLLARHDDAEVRLAASLARRSLEAERKRDPDEQILAALTEQDRAARAVLARRLRTLPVADVLARAKVLLADDPHGVIQVVAEVRAPEVTELLLGIARAPALEVAVRARAAGSIEADEPWERDALVELVLGATEPEIRVAGTRSLGAFAPPEVVLDRLEGLGQDPDPTVRGALLWALQLSVRPLAAVGGAAPDGLRARVEAIVRRALADEDPAVRRRAAYVAGNVDAAALLPDLVQLARKAEDAPELRIAAFVAAGEIGSRARFADLVHLWNREDDPDALAAASRALERALASGADEEVASMPPSLARVNDRLTKLASASDPRVRAAAARVAGLAPALVARELLAGLAEDESPRVREKAIASLGRVAGADAEAILLRALDDTDGAVRERAAEALVRLDGEEGWAKVLELVVRSSDRAAALRLATSLRASEGSRLDQLGEALRRLDPEDPVYETLLALRLTTLEAARPRGPTSAATPRATDAAIEALFPAWSKLRGLRAFGPLGRSLRTAEMLYAGSASDTASDAAHDCAPAIVLWMKSLEGYLHGWLGPRLRALQDRSATLWELADRLVTGWPSYQRYLGDRWTDPVRIGSLSVEVPLRSVVNALRDLQERRGRGADTPMSVTEWSRLILFLGLDHPTGPRNVLKLGCKEPERAVRLAHRLQSLAQVRNLVTHRTVADLDTLEAFRRGYYAAFEDLWGMG